LLGLDGAPDGPWPTSGEVGKRLGRTREQVVRTLDVAVDQWAAHPAFSDVVDAVTTLLARAGRVLTVPQLAMTLAAERGSTLSGDDRVTYAAALVRVVVESEGASGDPNVVARRRSVGVPLVALTEAADPDDVGGVFTPADELFELASALGAAADRLTEDARVLAAPEAAQRLQDVVRSSDMLDDDERVRLAAAASDHVAVSGLGELYPRSLPVERAVVIALRGRPGRSISDEWIRRRVEARFPDLTARVPSRPALDAVVSEALGGFTWQGTVYGPADSVTRVGTILRSTSVAAVSAPAADGTLRESLRRHSALTLCVPPSRYDETTRVLAATYAVTVVDLVEVALDSARELAAARGIRWGVALAADGDRSAPGWAQLVRLMNDAVRPRWAELMAEPGPLLLTNAGLLVRYEMSDLLSDLLDVATRRAAARWLLVPRDASRAVPFIEGRPVPLGPDRWLDLPAPSELLGLPAEPSRAATVAPTPGARA
jgi:hypothetical protein